MKKRRRSPCPSPHGDSGTENETMSFSRSEVEKMIDEAVLSAGIGREERYEAALYKLEDHIKKVKRRGEAAFAYIRKLGISSAQANKQDKSQLPSPAVAVKFGNSSRSDPDNETMNLELLDKKHGKSIDDKREKMEITKLSVQALKVDTEAMKTIIRKMKEEPLSPTRQSTLSDTPHSLQSKVGPSSMQDWIKKENVSPGHSPNHEKMQVEDEERKSLRTPVQQHSVSTPEDTESQMDDGNYPPFPPTPFPSLLNVEAASFNIPQAPTIQLARIKHPPGLSVLWNMEKDPSAPPMDLYSVYMTVEDAKGSGVFKEWKSLGEVKARELPMCVLVNKYRPEYKVCFTVVGKDTFGRYGTYSKVATATPPAP